MKINKPIVSAIMLLDMALFTCACADVDGDHSSMVGGSSSVQIVDSMGISIDASLNQTPGLTDNSVDTSSVSGETSTVIIEQAFPEKCRIYKQKTKMFTEDQLLKLFDDNPQRTEESLEGYSCITYTSDKYTGDITNGTALSFYSQAGSDHIVVFESLSSHTDEEKYISSKDSLSFKSREKTLEDLQLQLKNLFDITPDEWWAKDFYAVKKEGVDFYKEKITEEAAADAANSDESVDDKLQYSFQKLDNITSEDYYVLNIKFQIDGIPMYEGDGFDYGFGNAYSVPGSVAQIVYGENGIERLDLYYLTETDTSSDSFREVTLIAADKTQELIRNKFSSVILDADVEVYDCKLFYLPIPQNDLNSLFENYEAKPYYAFYWKETRSDEDETYVANYITYFDAVTGKELGTERGSHSEW